MWWILRRNRRHQHHHQRPTLWLSGSTISSIELTHNQEIEMVSQTLHVDQIDNLSIAALDARGNPVDRDLSTPLLCGHADRSQHVGRCFDPGG